MKRMKIIGMMLMAAVMAFGMSACTGIEDNPINPGPEPYEDGGGERGGASITINGTTFSVSYANWKADVLNGNDTFYTVQVANSANFADVDPFDVVSIVYKVTNGNAAELATGEFSDFEVSVARLSANEANARMFYAFASDTPGTKLKVTKSGSGYQIQFGAMKYTIDGSAGSPTYNGSAFSFTGSVTKGLSIQ